MIDDVIQNVPLQTLWSKWEFAIGILHKIVCRIATLVNSTMLPPVVVTRNATRASSALAVRHYSRSTMVKAEPVLHNATGKWEELKSKRPIDHDDEHVSSVVVVKFQVPSTLKN